MRKYLKFGISIVLAGFLYGYRASKTQAGYSSFAWLNSSLSQCFESPNDLTSGRYHQTFFKIVNDSASRFNNSSEGRIGFIKEEYRHVIAVSGNLAGSKRVRTSSEQLVQGSSGYPPPSGYDGSDEQGSLPPLPEKEDSGGDGGGGYNGGGYNGGGYNGGGYNGGGYNGGGTGGAGDSGAGDSGAGDSGAGDSGAGDSGAGDSSGGGSPQ